MQAEPLVRIRNLRKSYEVGRPVLRDVSLDLTAGRITALLARNGAGKSTAIALLAGKLKPDGGSIAWGGASAIPPADVGVAPQDTGVYPDLTTEENVRFMGRCYGLGGRDLAGRVAETVELFGLERLARQRARTLSGGQKRRLHTAMAVVHRPRLILLDEPTVGSDPGARNYILNAVKELARRGSAILYTSHYFPEIEALNADVAILHQGIIKTCAPLQELIARYGVGVRRVVRPEADLESVFLRMTDEAQDDEPTARHQEERYETQPEYTRA